MLFENHQDEPATASTTDRDRIEGPFLEYDRYGERTGAEYYRCSCDREALRRWDLVCADCREGR